MPQKRKKCGNASSGSEVRPSSKRCKATSTLPKLQAFHSTESDPATSSFTRHLTSLTDSELNSSVNLPWTATSAANSATNVLHENHSAQSRLIPRGERRAATVGRKDETLLRILCDDTDTGDIKELHFRNMPHSSIDWSDVNHIHKINNWRNQIYGRAGLKSKAVTMWLPDEELWFELYFHLSIAESRVRGILLPKNARVLEAFNNTLVGHIIQDQNGQYAAPRVPRQINAFASKFNRMCPNLRARLQQSIFGKSGDVFVPDITFEMLHAYKQMKIELAERGVKEECTYSEHLQEWCNLFAHLPSRGDDTTRNGQLSMSEDDAAAAVLLSLSQESAKSQSEHDVLKELDAGADNEAIDPSTSSVQYPIAPWNKSDVTWSRVERLSLSSSTSSPHKSDTLITPPQNESFINSTFSQCAYQRSATPVCELDISSLIASPD